MQNFNILAICFCFAHYSYDYIFLIKKSKLQKSYLLQSKLNQLLNLLFLQSGAKSFENCTIEIPEESNEDAETDSDGLEDIHWIPKF